MPTTVIRKYNKKRRLRPRRKRMIVKANKYRGTVARIPRALNLKPKSVCQKLVYYNSFHCVPGINSLNGNQQNYFFTLAINSPWPFINNWDSHAINNGRYMNPNTPIFPLSTSNQPDINTTAMPGLKDGYNLFHQYQNGTVVGTKITLSAQPTGRTNTENAEQSGVLYAVKHAKAGFGLQDTSTITDIQKLPFRQMKRIAGPSGGSGSDLSFYERNTGAKMVIKHSTKKFNNVQSLRDNQRFSFHQADSLNLYGQVPEDSDFLTVGIVPSLNAFQSGATIQQRKAPDVKLSMRIEQTILFTEPLENLGEGTGNYSLPWDARMYGGVGYTISRIAGLRV